MNCEQLCYNALAKYKKGYAVGSDFSFLNNILEIGREFIGDALIDTLEVIPFLFITYLILEFMENRMSSKALAKFEKAGPLGPIIGSALGALPQCGWSSAASTFFSGKVITIGTLFAVYLSTSDEMIPIFIAGGMPLETLLGMVGVKFAIGVIIGFAIDGCFKIFKLDKTERKERYEIHELCERDRCSCNHHDGKSQSKVLRPAIIHTFQVTIFIFIITLLLNIIIILVGGYETLAGLIDENRFMSVIGTSLIGLIPNCASSVVIAQLYVDGVLGMGALLAGLLDATGVALIVLFRNNRPMKQNIIITVAIFVISVVIGMIATLIVG